MAISIYIGIEIDYRHWSWVVFLILVPAAVLARLVLPLRRARAGGSRDPGRRRRSSMP